MAIGIGPTGAMADGLEELLAGLPEAAMLHQKAAVIEVGTAEVSVHGVSHLWVETLELNRDSEPI